MNYRRIGKYIGYIWLIEAVFMLPSVMLSLADGQQAAMNSFLISMLITMSLSAVLIYTCRNARSVFTAREGFICVGLSWIALSIMGCLPFVISGEIPRFIDALFETVSGFTTTGASILIDVERLSRGMLYWRSFTHWIGGMGVLVFMLAIAPKDEGGRGFTLHLLKAESPGPDVSKLVPHIRGTAQILYVIYIALTILDFCFLVAGGMEVFDAVCTAFGTAGTGGFGIKRDSIAGYSPYIQNVCTVFMLIFGVNFSCYYLFLNREFKAVFKDEELLTYLAIVVVSIGIITVNIKGFYPTFEETLRHASFQVSSIITTTGFATTDFDLWPSLSKAVILCLMLVGACAGSTGGGLKCGRFLLLLKTLRRQAHQILYPNKVQVVRSNGTAVPEKILQSINVYFSAYAMIIALSFIMVSVDGLSIPTNISAVISCFNNIGPGLDLAGPAYNYSMFSDLSKFTLIMDMLAGRLEIYPILILFSHTAWKRA